MLLYQPSQILPMFRTQRIPVTLGVGASRILAADSNRVSIWFPSSQTTGYYVMPETFAPTTYGVFIAQNSLGYEVKFSDHPGIVGLEWFAGTSAGAGSIIVYTSSFAPREVV